MTFELLQSMAWSIVGFLIGWVLGHQAQSIEDIRETIVPEKVVRDDKERVALSKKGWWILGLAVLSVVQGAVFGWQSRESAQRSQETAQCQAQFNQDFITVIQQRAIWATEDQLAQRKMLQIWSNATTRKQAKDALVAYLATVRENDQKRAATPLPKLEDRDC